MKPTTAWLRCRYCRHLVNPRSERCDEDHPLCTVDGCQVAGRYLGMDVPDPLGGADDATIRALADPPRAAGRTLYLLDVASYQAGINLAVCKAAGWSNVNIKTSQGNWYQHAAAVTYARAAQALGMGISGFHWLDNSDTGANQARYCWQILRQMIDAVGHPIGLQKDNEDAVRPATWAITRDFVNALSDLMGHLPFAYTGDWWATSGGRASWDVHSLTPWLMSAPNAGYLGTYPGDDSPHWHAGYWGYGDLAAMQYAVSPIANAGGGQISKTAIRDPAVWAAITGGTDMPLTDDDIRRIWEFKIGGSAKSQAAHYGLSDTRDMVMDGKSSYDGNGGFFLPREFRDLISAVKTLQTDLDLLQQGGIDYDQIASRFKPIIEQAVADAIARLDLHADLRPPAP